MTPVQPNDLISRIAEAQLGPAAAAPAPGAPQGAPPAPGPAAPQAPAGPGPDTAEAKAQKDASPQTEGDKMAESPVIYEVKGPDGKTMKLTPEQIMGMRSRYAALNHEHATLKPVIDLAKQMLANNPGATPADLASAVLAMSRAQQHNPTMGRGSENLPANTPPGSVPADDDFSKWEQENAAKLPPGYRDMMGGMQNMMRQFQQQQSLLQQLLAQSAGVADGARNMAMSTQNQAAANIQRSIANNLDRAQMSLQIPTERANDFMVWAGERGYVMDDFADPNLTFKVMSDFRNDMMSGEMDRLRGIHQRRTAFTGLAGATPMAPAGQAQQAPQDREFEDFAARQMAKRGLA